MNKLKEVLYGYNDKVSVIIDEKQYTGIIEIIDRFGTYFDNSEPHYDIFIEKDNLLIKHVPQSIIIKE